MKNMNGIIRAIAIVGVITLLTLTALPGCNLIGQADVDDQTTSPSADVNSGFEQCCPICTSADISGPDAEGFYSCNACGAKWGENNDQIDVTMPDGNVTQLDPNATTRPIIISGNSGNSGSGNNGGNGGNSGNGGNGGNNGTTFTTPTTGTTKSVKDQLAEIKDRWDDVIKPTIDADGNITVESVNGKDTGLFGFKYSQKDKCFITAEDAWQRNFGYNETYDGSAPAIAITYDTIRVKFDYDGMEWMIQYWKGQYGLVMVGAEIGVYNRPAGTAGTHYECANDETKLLQSMTVYRRVDGKYTQLFARSPSRTWWCTGFIPGTLGAGQYNVPIEATRELRVDSKITMASPEMTQAFVAGLKEIKSIYHNAPQVNQRFSFTEMSSVAEYESSSKNGKFVVEEDGVTVRVCWR